MIDEIGYLSYAHRNADRLFQALSMRYEKKSLVLTTNLAFADWPTIFPKASCAIALIDRIIHHADIIAIEGPATAYATPVRPRSGATDSRHSGPKIRGF